MTAGSSPMEIGNMKRGLEVCQDEEMDDGWECIQEEVLRQLTKKPPRIGLAYQGATGLGLRKESELEDMLVATAARGGWVLMLPHIWSSLQAPRRGASFWNIRTYVRHIWNQT